MAETAKKSTEFCVSARNNYQISNLKTERFYKCFAARLPFSIYYWRFNIYTKRVCLRYFVEAVRLNKLNVKDYNDFRAIIYFIERENFLSGSSAFE